MFKVTDESQSGATIILVAFLFSVLIGFAAFAVDFGWLYLNGIRIQHGADAAALAGVVYEPGDQPTAYAEARFSASENGYNHFAAGTTVTPIDFSDDTSGIVENPYQLAVTVEHTVDTFFMRIFGIDNISIGKTAVAEYVLPLPMGSDLPYFGEDPSIPGRDPHFWANIHGYYTGRSMGDRFASQCRDGGSGSGCTVNDDRRPTTYNALGQPISGGYLYGVEVDDTVSSLQVQAFDAPFYRLGSDYFLVGDNEQGGSQGPTTHFVLYGPDPTPLNTTDNPVLCHRVFGPEDSFADFDGDGDVGSKNGNDWDADPDDDLWPVAAPDGFFTWEDVEEGLPGGIASLWDNICPAAIPVSSAAVYPLRVVIEDPGAADDRGLNRYSLRANTTGNAPRFYGLGDMAVYVNFDGNTSTFNLAEVYPVHAGKELVIELWDPDSGNNGVEIYRPDGTLPQCSWSATDGRSGGPGPCDINYGSSFNNHHMQIRIDIADAYTCDTSPGGNCWWTIEVSYPGGANDTTTWSARIEGNPVALVK